MNANFFIIDGTALAYRAHFAFIKNPLINSKGQHTSALYGVISSFLKIYEDHHPQYIAISFDTHHKTFRHQMFDGYKANRPKTPDELLSQLDAITRFFTLIGIHDINQPGFEADDIIGTLATRFSKDFSVAIVSKDKDFAQLVNENISIYDHKENKFITTAEIVDKYEVNPSQFIDYLALIGDSSDNIPGAKGIGPKTAVKWLKLFSDIETLYDSIGKQPPTSDREKLINSKDDVFLSKKLATIDVNVPLGDLSLKSFAFDPRNLTNAVELLREYELKRLIPKIENFSYSLFSSFDDSLGSQSFPSSVGTPFVVSDTELTPKIPAQYTLICDITHLHTVLNTTQSKTIAIDTETTGLNTFTAELVGISFCFDHQNAYYIPLKHVFADNLNTSEVIATLKPFLKNKTIIGHNIKYDMQILDRYDLSLENIIGSSYQNLFDTMLAAYILDPGLIYFSLDDCSKRELNHTMTPISTLIGSGKKQITFDSVEVETACKYSAEDAFIAHTLYQIYHKRLKDTNLYDLYTQIEIPLVFTLSYMEKQGVKINTQELLCLNKELAQQIESLKLQIYEMAGMTFNINSPQQLAEVLFQKMGLPTQKKTKTGYSIDREVLEVLSEQYEIARHLIEYRQLTKLQNTYVETLPQLINPLTHRLHTSFNQTITSTGRLSSSAPNLQNIPIRTPLGKRIRAAFIADKDCSIISADYSQIELRIFACLSDDTAMLHAIKSGEDIHTNTASIIYGIPLNQVDSSQRKRAKSINFGIIYGMGAYSLSKELSIEVPEAKEFIADYFAHFPTIKSYIDRQKQAAHHNGYVETLYHRRLYLPAINSTNQGVIAEAERIAVNMPIQGTAADIIKIAMNRIYARIKDRTDIRMLVQVHDELVFQVHDSVVNEACTLIKQEMENVLTDDYKDKVLLKVDIGVGKNWAESH